MGKDFGGKSVACLVEVQEKSGGAESPMVPLNRLTKSQSLRQRHPVPSTLGGIQELGQLHTHRVTDLLNVSI